MVKVVAHWETWAGWKDDPQYLKRILAYHRYVLQAFNITDFAMVDIDGDCPDAIDLNTNFTKHSTLIDALQEHKNDKLVFLEAKTHIPDDVPSSDASLYIHPQDVVYILGPEYGWFNWESLRENGFLENADVIYMNLPGETPGSLMSHQALTAILYQRTSDSSI